MPPRKDRQRWRRFHYRYGEMRLTSHNGNNTLMCYDQQPNVHTRVLHLAAITPLLREPTCRADALDKVMLSFPFETRCVRELRLEAFRQEVSIRRLPNFATALAPVEPEIRANPWT